MNSNKIIDEQIIAACAESITMTHAATMLGLHYNTFFRRAKLLGCAFSNQGGKGSSKPKSIGPQHFNLQDILDGKYPSYQTFKLKNRLFAEKIKENKCEICNIDNWMGLELKCELDHIDGDRTNHVLTNLRIICPNCHSQTPTFRAKNKKNHISE